MNVKLPLVSIVIPTYKRSDKIKKSIDSALKQTYSNIEILVVDDNEPDSDYRRFTKEKLKKYIDEKKIRYIERSSNGGGSEARNTGIHESKGEFIAFLDDDDEYLPNKIEKQYNLYREKVGHNVGVIYCYINGLDKNGNIIQHYNGDIEGKPLYESMKGCIAGTSSWFCPKKALIDVGGFENTPSKQDTIMIMKLISCGYSIYRVPEYLLNYYEYQGNKISGSSKNAIIGECNALNYARNLYKLLKNNEEYIEIEYIYAKKLLSLFIINDMKEDAKIQLKLMLKIKGLNLDVIKGIGKYMLKDVYKSYIIAKSNQRFEN